MERGVKCDSRAGEPPTIEPMLSAVPVLPLPFSAVAKAFEHRTGIKISRQRCIQIHGKAMAKMRRAMAKLYPNMADEMNLNTKIKRHKYRQIVASHMRADTDVVGGGGTDAPVVED